MGCHSSKMVRVAPAGAPVPKVGESKIKQVVAKENAKNSDMNRQSDSRASLSSESSSREQETREKSAVSKASRKSGDSGFGHDDVGPELDDEENGHIITEHSENQLVMQIESSFKPVEGLDLSLCGTPAPRNLSAKDKVRREEQQIIEKLRLEGLIAKPQTEAKSGLSFEIVQESAPAGRAPPARLAKLDLSGKKRRRKVPTSGLVGVGRGIGVISEAPDSGSSGNEEVGGRKVAADWEDSTPLSVGRPEGSEQQQTEVQQILQAEKEKSALENRERRLQELRDKLRAKEAHAAAVRERKKLGAASITGETADVATEFGGAL